MITKAKLRMCLAYFLAFSLCLSLSQASAFAAEYDVTENTATSISQSSVDAEVFASPKSAGAASTATLVNARSTSIDEKHVKNQTLEPTVKRLGNSADNVVTISVEPLSGSISADYDKFKTYTPIFPESTDDSSRDLAPHSPDTDSVPADATVGRFSWAKSDGGYGIGSNIRIKTVKNTLNSRLGAHQFVLKNGENKYYVYCADLVVDPKNNARYNMQRIEDTDYYKNCGVREMTPEQIQNQIRAIVLNGYWGTAPDTVGSLEKFKQMLSDSSKFTLDEVSSVTDGMALTATQAAIWYYGNSNSDNDTVSENEIVGMYKESLSAEFTLVPENKAELVNKIYRYMINQDGMGLEPQEATSENTLIAKDDFAESITLTICDAACDENNADGKKYIADISISMKQISFDGLKLTIKSAEPSEPTKMNIIAEYELSETEYADGAYLLKGLTLPEETLITLCFSGRQIIENGVYLFSSCTTGVAEPVSQTFIGAGQAEQAIDLFTAFTFSVSKPTDEPTTPVPPHDTPSPKSDNCYTLQNDDDVSLCDDEAKSEDPIEYPKNPLVSINTENKNVMSKTNAAVSQAVTKASVVPKTGDINSSFLSWFLLTVFSVTCCLALLKRKF